MNTSNISFKANPTKLVNDLPKRMKPLVKLIKMQEEGLSNTRFIQDTAVNWAPKAIFARSLPDLAEVSLLEFAESILVYYFPTILGEKVFRKPFTKKLSEPLQKLVSKPAQELIQNSKAGKLVNNTKVEAKDLKELLPAKAGIAIGAMAIPIAEYSLNFIKNLFTLKVFKQADFNNIANLNKNKNKTETQIKQEKVEKSAKKHLKIAGAALAGCLGLATLLATKGKNSKGLQQFSEVILTPGNKLFPKNSKKAATFNKYFSLDFADNNGKLSLSRGQLTACVLAGFAGYAGAAKDRGKQNLLEVLFRFPLVGFYVVTGSELFEKGFKKILQNKGKCKEVLGKNLEVPTLKELPNIAEKLAKQNGTQLEDEFKKIFKQKSLITAVPFAFSIGVMGLFVAGVSRFFTQYRYNQDKKKQELQNQAVSFGRTSLEEFQNKVNKK